MHWAWGHWEEAEGRGAGSRGENSSFLLPVFFLTPYSPLPTPRMQPLRRESFNDNC